MNQASCWGPTNVCCHSNLESRTCVPLDEEVCIIVEVKNKFSLEVTSIYHITQRKHKYSPGTEPDVIQVSLQADSQQWWFWNCNSATYSYLDHTCHCNNATCGQLHHARAIAILQHTASWGMHVPLQYMASCTIMPLQYSNIWPTSQCMCHGHIAALGWSLKCALTQLYVSRQSVCLEDRFLITKFAGIPSFQNSPIYPWVKMFCHPYSRGELVLNTYLCLFCMPLCWFTEQAGYAVWKHKYLNKYRYIIFITYRRNRFPITQYIDYHHSRYTATYCNEETMVIYQGVTADSYTTQKCLLTNMHRYATWASTLKMTTSTHKSACACIITNKHWHTAFILRTLHYAALFSVFPML
jgi:hypothetical protein